MLIYVYRHPVVIELKDEDDRQVLSLHSLHSLHIEE